MDQTPSRDLRFPERAGARAAAAAMRAVVGPVVIQGGGYGFEMWTREQGLRRSFCYRRVEDACYARKVEIALQSGSTARLTLACATLDQFVDAHRQAQGFARPS